MSAAWFYRVDDKLHRSQPEAKEEIPLADEYDKMFDEESKDD